MYVISYDVGTTGIKTCLFKIEESIELIGGMTEEYGLYILDNGGAEQDADEWWTAMCRSTKALMAKSGVDPAAVEGITFCSQMQGMVLVDRDGNALRRPMSYMDQRGTAEFKEVSGHGIRISGVNVFMLLKSLRRTCAASTSVKDPIWKYKWVQKHEPEIFAKVYKWLDVKEYLICRATGECVMTRDSAYSTFLYDSRKGHECFSPELCRMYGIAEEHLPRLIECTDVAGKLNERAAGELGLAVGTDVYGGGGDATLIGVGSGCTEVGRTHVYSGTSGWVSTIIDKQKVDIVAMIAGIVGAEHGKFNYFAEMETAGKCFSWAREHLAAEGADYDDLSGMAAKVPAGSNGVIFTPWLHGNRCPFEDAKAAGMFFNIKLETGKNEMIRAVLEGICYHLRWMLECSEKKIRTSDPVRFVGGNAASDVMCRMFADITGRRVETVKDTRYVGSVGAAMLVAVGSGRCKDLTDAAKLVEVVKTYEPDPENRAVYDRSYQVFKQLYNSNKRNFDLLNR